MKLIHCCIDKSYFWKNTKHGPEVKPEEPWWTVRKLFCRCSDGAWHLWFYTKRGALFVRVPWRKSKSYRSPINLG